MSNIDKQALCVPERKKHNWCQAVMRDCDFCQQWALTVRHSDGGCICASCCDSEYTTALSSVLVVALDELEAKEEERANWFQMAEKLGAELDAAERRIAELEAVKCKLSDSKLLSLAKDIVENLVDTGSSEPEYTQQYVDWTCKRIRAAAGKGK